MREGREGVMADALTRREIRRLPVVPYNKIRNVLETGDLFFASGSYLISKLIRKFTKSPWSHVGIIFPVHSPSGALLLESVEDTGEKRAFGASQRRERCAPSLGASSLTLASLSHPRGECALARSKSDTRRDSLSKQKDK